MPRRQNTYAIPSLGSLDRDAGRVGRQLAQSLRDVIANGEMKAGERLPSTRTLATSLGLARGTVVEAFDQLRAEGYLEARARGGTTVANVLVGANLVADPARRVRTAKTEPTLPANVARLSAVAKTFRPQKPWPFAIAHPAGAVAPDDKWRRLGNQIRGSRVGAPTGYIDPKGVRELRAAIAGYVRKARAVKCEPEQVVITGGTQQGLFIAATVLLSKNDAVWTEDPAYPGILAVLGNFNVQVFRIPVDVQGINVKQGLRRCPRARVAFVTPSHQYPLAMPMSMARRAELLSWARRQNTWIVEDDYDSELRYAGHPFPSLQGLDPSRVVYLGTMSKVLFSSIRLGYAIVPEPLVEAFAGARALIDRHSPSADQYVLAQYMREGYFEAHIRRIRVAYAERRAVLMGEIERQLPSWVTLQPSDQGMHLVLWLPPDMDDIAVTQQAYKAGLVVRPVSPMYGASPARVGLMLGFGGFSAEQLRTGVARLKKVLDGSAEASRVRTNVR
jgi:GntR family transcriptional regulator / MocR family aminotransferase